MGYFTSHVCFHITRQRIFYNTLYSLDLLNAVHLTQIHASIDWNLWLWQNIHKLMQQTFVYGLSVLNPLILTSGNKTHWNSLFLASCDRHNNTRLSDRFIFHMCMLNQYQPFKRRVKSHLPFAGIVRSLSYVFSTLAG
jgi:hypothetical protein